MSIPNVRELPTPPTQADSETFNTRADGFMKGLDGIHEDLNAFAAAVNELIPAIEKAAQAETHANTATDKATIATTEATKAGDARIISEQARDAALAYANEAGSRASGAAAWSPETRTVARVSDTVFSVTGDAIAIYEVGRSVRLTQGTPAVGMVTGASLQSGNTHVSISGATVQADLSAVAYGVQASALPDLSHKTQIISLSRNFSNTSPGAQVIATDFRPRRIRFDYVYLFSSYKFASGIWEESGPSQRAYGLLESGEMIPAGGIVMRGGVNGSNFESASVGGVTDNSFTLTWAEAGVSEGIIHANIIVEGW